MLSWGEVYQDEVTRQVGELTDAKRRGQTWRVIDGRTYDPSRMTDRQLRQLAEREAERSINYAINVELEQARKAGRPADNY